MLAAKVPRLARTSNVDQRFFQTYIDTNELRKALEAKESNSQSTTTSIRRSPVKRCRYHCDWQTAGRKRAANRQLRKRDGNEGLGVTAHTRLVSFQPRSVDRVSCQRDKSQIRGRFCTLVPVITGLFLRLLAKCAKFAKLGSKERRPNDRLWAI